MKLTPAKSWEEIAAAFTAAGEPMTPRQAYNEARQAINKMHKILCQRGLSADDLLPRRGRELLPIPQIKWTSTDHVD